MGPLEAVIGTFGEGVADLDPHEAVIDTFGEGVADFDPHDALTDTFGEGVTDLDHHETTTGTCTFGGGVIDLDPHESAICTFSMGVGVLDPQEVVIVDSAVTSMTRDDEAETFEGKAQSWNPPLPCTGFADPAKLTDVGSSLRRSARNENAPSKESLAG